MQRGLRATVAVAALGYFVDIYDLQLFSVVRAASLRGVGVPEARLLEEGVFLINAQMAGMLLGGFLWGVLGDRRGRVAVLYASIALYSVANIANGFVHAVGPYALWRFVAGVGLAGELGAAVTLVSELMPANTRGYGTTLVAVVGLLGAVVAALVGEFFPWRAAYIVGGVLGFVLLAARMRMLESGMFKSARDREVRRGDLRVLFGTPERAWRYLCCVLVGVPIWYALGVLMTFAPEIAAAQGVTGRVLGPRAVLATYLGVVAGNVATGLLSQRLRSRRRVLAVSLALSATMVAVDLFQRSPSVFQVYLTLGALGVAIGYWAVFATVAAEQFGTNLRATVATTVPNLVRGGVVPLTLAFKALKGSRGAVTSAGVVGAVALSLAVVGLIFLRESYGRELDYVEGDR